MVRLGISKAYWKPLYVQVPADEVLEIKQEPKIDFTYSGQQKLDLGFGPSGNSGPQQPVQVLSWERLRKVRLSLLRQWYGTSI